MRSKATMGRPRLGGLPRLQMVLRRRTLLRRVMAKAPELVAEVGRNLRPEDVINQVLVALSKGQSPGMAATRPWTAPRQHRDRPNRGASTTHVVSTNGGIQRGKTAVKALQAVTAYVVACDATIFDVTCTIVLTPMVPWAQSLEKGMQRKTWHLPSSKSL